MFIKIYMAHLKMNMNICSQKTNSNNKLRSNLYVLSNWHFSFDCIMRKKIKKYLRATGVKLRPGGDELPQVVGAQDGGVPRQVVKVVHDDRHKEIQHDEAAEEDEGDEIDVGHI